MSIRDIDMLMRRLRPGQIFRLWYMGMWAWEKKVVDGCTLLAYDDIEIDEEDAEAALSNTHLDYEVVVPPTGTRAIGDVRLVRNGKRSTFVFNATGVHHIELLNE